MTPVGFEPTQFALVELESTPLDHSGKVSTDRFTKIAATASGTDFFPSNPCAEAAEKMDHKQQKRDRWLRRSCACLFEAHGRRQLSGTFCKGCYAVCLPQSCRDSSPESPP